MVRVIVNKDIISAYFDAVGWRLFDEGERLKKFIADYPQEYKLITKNNRIRTKLNKVFECFKLNNDVAVFGTLTFNDTSLLLSLATLRQRAIRHLTEYLKAYCYVEEYGEENGRYHIHFIGAMKDGITYNDFNEGWRSHDGERVQIERVRSRKRAKDYVCDYLKKSTFKLHMSKNLVKALKILKKSDMWSRFDFNYYSNEIKMSIPGVLDDLPF